MCFINTSQLLLKPLILNHNKQLFNQHLLLLLRS